MNPSMSLFPAYSPNTSQHEESSCKDLLADKSSKSVDLSWLENSSYSVEEEKKKQDGADETIISEKKVNASKKKKDEKNKRSKLRVKQVKSKSAITSTIDESDIFYEDKKQDRGNFLVQTLHRPAIPRYNKYSPYFNNYNYAKKKLKTRKDLRRYFNNKISKKEDKVEDISDLGNEMKVKEEELTKMTEDFNKKLADNPSNEDLWLDYAQFQDTVYSFEKTYRKNPIGGDKVTSERKLAILERAIEKNGRSERLVGARLNELEQLWPADQVAEECTNALKQDPGNLALWRALVRSLRNNMARCTVPGVLQVFSRAITRVGQLRLHRPGIVVERDILLLVLECGLFLQQAGLWEQLWTLLQMYLSLSLTASGQFSVPALLDEDKLREDEDRVVACGLPMSELWLRVERLRATTHFLPDPNCDSDPQRVVFSNDMAELLQPVLSAELRLSLVVTALVLLKVPLLPTRQSTLLCLRLLGVHSAVDGVETILAAAYSTTQSQCRYLTGVSELVCQPNWLVPGPYRDWVLSVLSHCAALLPHEDTVLLHAWSLRLYALLCRLHTLHLTGDVSPAKQARSHAKQLLKTPQLRDNLLLYAEYALIERDTGNLDKACKVLEVAASNKPSEPNTNYVYLCRHFVKCLLLKDPVRNKENAVRQLMSLFDQQPSEVSVKQSFEKRKDQTAMLVDRWRPLASEPLTLAAAMTPHLIVEWLICHTTLLVLTSSVWDACALLQTHIQQIPSAANTLGYLWTEQLYEALAETLQSHAAQSGTSYSQLRSSLNAALQLYPSNLTLLNILATIETRSGGGGSSLWKLTTYFPSSSILARLILVFVVRYRILQLDLESGSRSHYIHSLIQRLTCDPGVSQCPLMWRLQLQLVASSPAAAPHSVRSAFYKCLNACPWVKSFYLDAVKFLPEEMAEIQDLMIEKELRLHATPEELDILRD